MNHSDKESIVNDYFEGNGYLLAYPYSKYASHQEIYIPLEEQSEAVQELFTYNPEKAKQLLAEAGYSDGFKTNIVCSAAAADFLSMIREYFLDINVDMEIKTLEGGQYASVAFGRTYEQMVYGMVRCDVPYMLFDLRKDQMFNPSLFETERTIEAWSTMSKVLGKNDSEVIRIMRDMGPYALEEAWGVWVPAPYRYTMWWPWFQNYFGQWDMGYACQFRGYTYIWVDQALKESMGH